MIVKCTFPFWYLLYLYE